MLGVFRSSRHSLQQDVPSVRDPAPHVSSMSDVFSLPYTQLYSSSTGPPTLDPMDQVPMHHQRSTSLREARHHPRLSLPARPRISRDTLRDTFSLPGHQPLRMLFFGGAHSGRLFSRRLRRQGREEPLSYETMLALDEHNPRRAVKCHVLDRLPTVCPLQRAMRTAQGCGSEDCRICLEPWTPSMQRMLLPCGHSFCSACSRSWLECNSSCPTCRWSFPDHDTYLQSCPCFVG